MISGFNDLEQYKNGFFCFADMVRAGISRMQSSFASIIVACAEMDGNGCLMQVHCFSLKSGFSSDCCVGNSLLKGYSRLGEVDDLWEVSNEMCDLGEISIEILSRGYSQNGMFIDALNLIRYCCINGIKALSQFLA